MMFPGTTRQVSGPQGSTLAGRRFGRAVAAVGVVGVLVVSLLAAAPAGAQSDAVSVTDFDSAGLEVVVLASFTAGGSTTLFAAAGSRWGESGSSVSGDVELAEGSRVVRVMVPKSDGSWLRLNDDGPLVLREFFGPSGEGADLTVWVLTAAGTASFAASDVATAGSNYVNFAVPAAGRGLLAGIGAGDGFVLALTRPAPEPPVATTAEEPPAETSVEPSAGTSGAPSVVSRKPTFEHPAQLSAELAEALGGMSLKPPPRSSSGPRSDPVTVSVSEPAGGDLAAAANTTGVVVADSPARGTIERTIVDEPGRRVDRNDVDWFKAELVAGSSYVFELLGVPAVNCTLRAPLIEAVYDASGQRVEGTGWEESPDGSWSRLEFTPASGGAYFVAVTGEEHYAGTGSYVLALTAAGSGSAAAVTAVAAAGCAASKPTGPVTRLMLTPGYEQVTLQWEAPGGPVTGYRIFRGSSAATLSQLVGDTASAATSYVDATAASGTTYFYAVAAINSLGTGPQSTTATTTTLDSPVVVPPDEEIDQQHPFSGPVEVLAERLGTRSGTITKRTGDAPHQVGFTTAAGQPGFLLHSVTVNIWNANDTVTVSVHNDEAGSPGHQIAQGRIEKINTGYEELSVAHLDAFLLPGTRYWITFDLHDYEYEVPPELLDPPQSEPRRSNTLFGTSTATTLDMTSMPGWTIDGNTQISLKGRTVALSPIPTTPTSETLLDTIEDNMRSAGVSFGHTTRQAWRFTTGAHRYGYDLAAMQARMAATANFLPILPVAAVYRDTASPPTPTDEPLITLTAPEVSSDTGQDVPFTAPSGSYLEPDTTYWLHFSGVATTPGRLWVTTGDNATSRDGWSIIKQQYWSITSGQSWSTARTARPMVALEGARAIPTQREPSPGDFPASEHTPGLLRVGEVSTGNLGDVSDRDWFRIEGMVPDRTYRLEVDFQGVGLEGGGVSIHVSSGGRVSPRSDLWESNHDGHTVLDFSVAPGRSTYFVSVESGNSMNRIGDRDSFVGDYTVTLTPLEGVRRMVSNTAQTDSDRMRFSNIGHLHDEGFAGHVREMAVSFTTGAHTAGYTLDKVTAHLAEGRRSVHLGTGTITDVGSEQPGADLDVDTEPYDITAQVPTDPEPLVAIYTNTSMGSPDSELCRLEQLSALETNIHVHAFMDLPDNLYAGSCADITLAASTTYWVVFKSLEPFPDSHYRVGHAKGANEDPRGQSGWQIGNNTRYRIYANGPDRGWRTHSTNPPLAIGIHAKAN